MPFHGMVHLRRLVADQSEFKAMAIHGSTVSCQSVTNKAKAHSATDGTPNCCGAVECQCKESARSSSWDAAARSPIAR
eukprot:5732011-Amphidinium_carterae.1